MRIVTIAVSLALFPLCAQVRAADKALPGGIGPLIREFEPPDLVGFPEGTRLVNVETLCVRAPGTCKVSWRFERETPTGPLVPRDADIDEEEDVPPTIVFPDTPPAEGPLEALTTAVKALALGDIARVRAYIPQGEGDDFESEGKELVEEFNERFRQWGTTAAVWADTFLPKCNGLPRKCGAVEIEYVFPGFAGERLGLFRVEIELHLEGGENFQWKIDEFEPHFEAKDDVDPGMMAKVLPADGLYRSLAAFGLPDIGSFPQGTREIEIRCWRFHEDRIYEIKGEFVWVEEFHRFFFADFNISRLKEPRKGMVIPSRPPAEGPLASLKRLLEALRDWDMETVLQHMPKRQREKFREAGLSLEDLKRELEEEVRREVERNGFSPLQVILASIPASLSAPENWIGLEIEFKFPGEVRGQKGFFNLDLQMIVEDPQADHWVVKDLDADFDKEE